MKKVLLIGSSYSALPFAKIIKSKGFFLGVVGYKKDDPCHKIADSSYFIDYSVKSKVNEIFTIEKYDYVVPSSNDSSYLSLLDQTSKFNYLDRNENINLFHNKNVFKSFLKKINVNTPRYYDSIDDIKEGKNYIIKPSDSNSGKGINVFSNTDNLKKLIQIAKSNSRDNKYIIEDFIEGSLHSISCFIQNQKIVKNYFVDEFCTTYSYQVDFSYYPSILSLNIKKKVIYNIEKILKHVIVSNGLIHTQFLIDKNNEVWIIESMRRSPGDLYSHLFELYNDYEYNINYVNAFLGIPIKFSTKEKKELKRVFRHTLSVNSASIFEKFNFKSDKIQEIEYFPLKLSGEILNSAPNDKAGIIFYIKEIDSEINVINELNQIVYES